MNEDIYKKLEIEIKRRCKSSNNTSGYGAWTHHIKSVVEIGSKLAKEYNADVEIVRIAALLHDVASITKEEYKENHHIYGAQIAEELLENLNYPKEKIEKIKQCILNHRGSILKEKNTNEEICLADADAMAHFDNLPSMFSLVYRERKLSVKKGENFVKNKLKRSYNKLSLRGKKIYKENYENIMKIFK